ncbi:hypothetical protein [Anaeromyxobacter dehalogenans]|uniref:Uncharacterized protein n=1 Tax=Anaeromyxobacter dehalogenans (strain 2CP-C) TaxID=290397 RepID=Q2IIT7_ANADE|nr:hypothetical protein [Anaeromyxobacter dehalogenans]ABC81570.1 hypothetical protein Adeh_1797 [Anaeromyxobacter dehalogenans 2CP-C]
MPAPTKPDPRTELALTRERLSDLGQKFPQANAAVSAAAVAAERAKVELDLRPDDKDARKAADAAAERFEEVVGERDTILEAIERLRKHENTLAAMVAAETTADMAQAQAAARKANADAVRAGAPAVLAWVGRIILDSELAGRQVANLGQLIAEYLTGSFQHSSLSSGYQQGINAAWAESRRLREALERGEVL